MGVVTISKTYSFSASHVLNGLPEDHPCSRLHGHNYTVTVTLRGRPSQLSRFSMLVDYKVLDRTIGHWLGDTFDHRHLNDVLGSEDTYANPTAEFLAMHIAEHCMKIPNVGQFLHSVTVQETPKTSATYEV